MYNKYPPVEASVYLCHRHSKQWLRATKHVIHIIWMLTVLLLTEQPQQHCSHGRYELNVTPHLLCLLLLTEQKAQLLTRKSKQASCFVSKTFCSKATSNLNLNVRFSLSGIYQWLSQLCSRSLLHLLFQLSEKCGSWRIVVCTKFYEIRFSNYCWIMEKKNV